MNKINWFESRGLDVLNYQQKALTEVKASMIEREITILAAAPTAGKTAMSIHIIEWFFKENPNSKILVLTHGTTVLRTQYFSDMDDLYIKNKKRPVTAPFDYKLVDSFTEYDAQRTVNITLPQTIASHLDNLGEVDLLLVDEAHERYFAKELQSIIETVKPKKQLLLTGSPDPFILKEIPIIPISLLTVYQEGRASEVLVELASSNTDFIMDDYNVDGEIKFKSQHKFTQKNTEDTMDALLGKIMSRLKGVYGTKIINFVPDWFPALKQLKKTMIPCHNLAQAEFVETYFRNKGIKCVKSTYDTDVDSLEIQRFKDEPEILVLIVLYRGILGLNLPELCNVVDLTGSDNIRRVWQLFCRLARPYEGEKKFFFKVVPQMLTDYFQFRMMATLCLMDDEWFLKFNGKNFDEFRVVHEKKKKTSVPEPNDDDEEKGGRRKTIPIKFLGLPVFEFFTNIYHKKNKLLETYAWTTMRDIRAEFMDKKPNGYWIKEKCMESAAPHNRPSDWNNANTSAYKIALDNGWYDECIAHMTEGNKLRTLEECMASAAPHNKPSDWQIADINAYSSARKNGWLKKCCKHMTDTLKKRTLEECMASAAPHNRTVDWRRVDSKLFNAAYTNGWLEQCTAHMTGNRNREGFLTKKKCMASAAPHNRPNDWKKEDRHAYNAAYRHGWYKECTKHMDKPRKHTLKSCMASAAPHNRPIDWNRADQTAYQISVERGWHKKCCAHMTEKTKNYTLKSCMTSAVPHNKPSDWEKADLGSYNAARRHGWYKKCCAHMTETLRKHTLESCMISAAPHKTKKDWFESDRPSYKAAYRRPEWFKKCIAHMK